MYWKSALSIPYSPLMDCYFYTSANGEWQVAVYTLSFFFIVSINGLLLLHENQMIYLDITGAFPDFPIPLQANQLLCMAYVPYSLHHLQRRSEAVLHTAWPNLHYR